MDAIYNAMLLKIIKRNYEIKRTLLLNINEHLMLVYLVQMSISISVCNCLLHVVEFFFYDHFYYVSEVRKTLVLSALYSTKIHIAE